MNRTRFYIVAGAALVAVLAVWLMRHGDHLSTASHAEPRPALRPPNSTPLAPRATASPDEIAFVSDDDRAGALRLEGQVIDEHEQPVGGAEVTINTNPPRTLRTAGDGSFHVDALIARTYTLVARADAGFAGPVIARLTHATEPVILRLHPAAAVEVRVLSARDGKPVGSANVEARALATISGATDQDGKLRLVGVGPGPCTIAAWAPGYAKTLQELHVPSATTNAMIVARIDLRLQPGASVSGRVLSPDGAAVAGARVRFSGLSEFGSRADPVRDSVATDSEGRYRFDAVAAGTFRFQATHPQHAPGTSPPMQLDGRAERSDVDIRLEAAATLAGDVVSKAGEPIAFATLRIAARTIGLAYDTPRQASTDEAGHFEITGLPRRELQIVALHESATSRMVSVDLTGVAAKRDLVIKLDEDGAIGGTVVDAFGKPLAGVAVWANRKVGTGEMRFVNQLRGFAQEMTDAAGNFRIPGLAPADYLIYASRGVGARKGDMRLREGVPAHIGDMHVKITLGEDGGIQGTVALADGSSPAMFTVYVGRGAPFAFLASDGHFVITSLSAGTADVRVEGPSFDPRGVGDVAIQSGKIADLGTIVVQRGRVITGRVLTPNNVPVPNANIYAGAHLFGDGQQAAPIDVNLPGSHGAPMIQSTSSDDGSYTLHGIGTGDLTVMAEDDTLGRSLMQTVPGSPDATTLDLVLLPFSAIEGVVTQGGQPLGSVVVTATAQSAATSSFVVSTGPDGTFRFDRLAPDTYKVSAVSGRSPKLGLGYVGSTVQAIGGQTASVHLELDQGITLLVTVTAVGAQLERAIVYVLAGSYAPANAKVLVALAGTVPGFTFVGAALAGSPATAQSVPSGHYTVCAVAMPNEVDGMSKAFAYIDREGDHLPAVCTQLDVAAAPAQQSTRLQVTIPTYVPPPDGTKDPGGSGAGSGSGGSGNSGSGGKGNGSSS